MSELLFGFDHAVAEWVAQRIPHMHGQGFGPCAAIGVVNNGKMLAGIVYHDYQPEYGTIQLSMASDNPMWARRRIINGLLAYPFHQVGVNKVWTATPHDNELALRVNRHIGFKPEATLAHHFGMKRHAVICRMLRTEYDRLFGDS